MTDDRVVLIDGAQGRGAGYAVGARLVLTSAHVVGSARTVPLYRPAGGGTLRGTVVWRGSGGHRDDAALVHVDDDEWSPPRTVGIRWGELVTSRPGRRCDAQGAPSVAQYERTPDGARRAKGFTELWQVSGSINPGSGYAGDRYVVDLDGEPPTWPFEGLPWGGLSGAALLSDGFVVGVVAAEVPFFGHGYLEAVPAYVLHHDASFRAALERYDADSLLLEPVEFHALIDRESFRPRRPGGYPTALLRPEQEAVGFHGRTELLSDLLEWCAEDGVAALLVHGPGGQGKTRLVRELADRLTAASDDPSRARWTVVWLKRPGKDGAGQDLGCLQETARCVLVVIDYAETRLGQLAVLVDSLRARDIPFKIVLIARSKGRWWQEDAPDSSNTAWNLLRGAAAVELQPLAEDETERPELFRKAVASFAERLPLMDGQQDVAWGEVAAALPERDLGHPAFANMLTLHMTALADLLDAGLPEARPRESRSGLQRGQQSPDDVETRLLGHETRFWKRVLEAKGYDGPTAKVDLIKDALAAATLLGAEDPIRADAVLLRVRGLADEGLRGEVGDCLTAIYPPSDPGAGPWGSIQPDRLAERFVGHRVLSRAHLLPALITGIDAAEAEQLLTVLTRACGHKPLRAELAPVVTRLCTEHPDALARSAIAGVTRVEDPAPLLEALSGLLEAPQTSPEHLEEWTRALPHRSYHLGPWAVRLLERVVAQRRERLDGTSEGLLALTIGLRELAKHCSGTGDDNRALTVVNEAIGLLEPAANALGDADPQALELRNIQAGCLNNQAVFLSSLGRLSDALDAADRAVDTFLMLERNAALEDPDNLLTALGTLATACGDLGDLARAGLLRKEVADRRRQLARPGDEDGEQALALALNNLALDYHLTGRDAEGLKHSREAVALLRPLARRRPDAHRPLLATALGTLADCLAALGHDVDALKAAEEAVAIRRPLAAGRPAAYRGELARSLNSLSIELSSAGRGREARAAARQSVELFESLVKDEPEAYRESLAMTLNTYSNELEDAGEPEQAARAAERAVEIYADLHRALPDAFATPHAMALNSLGLRLDRLGRPVDGLARMNEAARIYRGLPDHLTAAARPDFATCLNNIAALHRAGGRGAQALEACEEGVAITRNLAAANPGGFKPLLARLLTTQAMCLRTTGRLEGIPAIAKEAVAAATGTATRPESAGMLAALAALLALAGHSEQASEALETVVDAQRRLARIDPDRHQHHLLDSLNLLSTQFARAGRLQDAATSAAEVLEIRRLQWHQDGGIAQQAALAIALGNLGNILSQAERRSEASGYVEEAVTLWRALPDSDRDAHLPYPAMALVSHGGLLWARGHGAEALAALGEAADAFQHLPDSSPTHQAGTAMALTLQGAFLFEAEGPAVALPVLDRAVVAARSITGQGLEAYETVVANALGTRAQVRAESEPPAPAALPDAAEAVEITRRLHAAVPGNPSSEAQVAPGLATLGLCLAQAGRLAEALATTDEAISIASRARAARVALADVTAVSAMLAYARVRLLADTQLPQALARLDEGIELINRVARTEPALVAYAVRKADDIRAELTARLAADR